MDSADVRGLLGLLLADGSLVPYRTVGGGYIQLTLTAGAAESAFLEEKVAEFRHFIPTNANIVHYETPKRANGRSTSALRFRVSTDKLRPVYNLLYPHGEREITQTSLDLLGAKALAWCWAEGSRVLKDGSVQLARVGATIQEARLMSSWVEVLTGAISTIDEKRVKPRLTFTPDQAVKVRKALVDYAPKSRVHLFQEEQWDVSKIRGARTELHLGKRRGRPKGSKKAPVAGDCST